MSGNVMSMDEAAVQEVLAGLRSPEPQDRAIMLRLIAEEATGAESVRRAIEPLLDDRALGTTKPPLRWLEIRRLAAEALLAERRAAGIPQPVELENVPPALDLGELNHLADAIYGEAARRWNGFQLYRRLRDDGHLPRGRLCLRP